MMSRALPILREAAAMVVDDFYSQLEQELEREIEWLAEEGDDVCNWEAHLRTIAEAFVDEHMGTREIAVALLITTPHDELSIRAAREIACGLAEGFIHGRLARSARRRKSSKYPQSWVRQLLQIRPTPNCGRNPANK